MKVHLVKAVCPLYQMSLKMNQSTKDHQQKLKVHKMTWYNQVQDNMIDKRPKGTRNQAQYFR